MKAGNDFAANLMDALDDEGIMWRSYSGRGMFGDCCVAVACGGSHDFDEEQVLEAVMHVQGGLRPLRDQLGMGTIMYWPSAKIVDGESETVVPQ